MVIQNPELKRIIDSQDHERFMRESNRIEGEMDNGQGCINPGDLEAVHFLFYMNSVSKRNLLKLHRMLGSHLQKPWVGKYRDCQVFVGSYVPPAPERVEFLMERYCKAYHSFDSWTAYNEFEAIHPFEDLNGRMGRLLWLKKAVTEGFKYQRTFLEQYHYQTLQHYTPHDPEITKVPEPDPVDKVLAQTN